MDELTDDQIWTDAYGAFDPETLTYAVTRLLSEYMKREGGTHDAAVHCVYACEAAKSDLMGVIRTGGDLSAFGRR